MDSIDTSRLSEDQQYELAEAAMVAYGLEALSPAELVEGELSETLSYGEYKVLDYQEARDDMPASLLWEVRYDAPLHDEYGRERQYIGLYKRQFRIFMASAPEGLEALGDNPQACAENAGEVPLEPLGGGVKCMKEWAEDCGLPQDGNFYAAVYAQPGLHIVGKMPRLLDHSSVVNWRAATDLLEHAGIVGGVRKKLIAVPSVNKRSLFTENYQINVSGQSGVHTFLGIVYIAGENNDKARVRIIKNYAISVATNVASEPLIRHSAKWQRILGQDAPEDERIPTPEIVSDPRRYYGGELYYVQRNSWDGHFNTGIGHVAALGKALGRIHNRPANEAEPPPVSSVLDAGKLVTSAKNGLAAAETRTCEGRKHGTSERMKQSIRGRLFERFSFDEIQRREPELCRQVGLTQAAAERHALMQRKKAEEDATLPQGLCHGDMHAKNLLSSGKKHIELIDFQLTGKGVFADELVLALYFFCVGEDGKLDAGLTRAFFDEYRQARCRDDKGTGNIPLTKQELRAIPERLSRLAQRQTHPIWEMFRNSEEEWYSSYAERNHALPEQIGQMMRAGGAERFAREFVGVELAGLPDYAPEIPRGHAARENRRKTTAASKDNGEFTNWADRSTRESGQRLVGSGV